MFDPYTNKKPTSYGSTTKYTISTQRKPKVKTSRDVKKLVTEKCDTRILMAPVYERNEEQTIYTELSQPEDENSTILLYLMCIISVLLFTIYIYVYLGSEIYEITIQQLDIMITKISSFKPSFIDILRFIFRCYGGKIPTLTECHHTTMHDYALYANGARVISSHTSPNYFSSGVAGIILSMLAKYKGIINSPDTALKPSIHLGQCWPMAGSQGQLAIYLSAHVNITNIIIEHPPLHNLVNKGSAPWDMELWGQPAHQNCSSEICDLEFLIGFEYNLYSNSVQTFSVYSKTYMQAVVLKIISNWGNPNYTCLYKVGIYGIEE
jgi:Sad1 / UNC-like C-terminal